MTHTTEHETRRASNSQVSNTDVIKAKLTKKPLKPLQDKTQAQNITTGALSKKLQIKNKTIRIPKKSPLRISTLKQLSPKRLTPNASKVHRYRDRVEDEKENGNPATPSNTMRSRKTLNERSAREAYCNEVLHSISAELSQINSIFEAINDTPSLNKYQERLEKVVRDIEAKLRAYIGEQCDSGGTEDDPKEVDEQSLRIQKLQEQLDQLQSKYIPKSEFIQVKEELEVSEEILQEHRHLLEVAVSSSSSQTQLKQLEEQNEMIDNLQKQLLITAPYESKYLESQSEVQQLRTAVTELLYENEQLYTQQQK